MVIFPPLTLLRATALSLPIQLCVPPTNLHSLNCSHVYGLPSIGALLTYRGYTLEKSDPSQKLRSVKNSWSRGRTTCPSPLCMLGLGLPWACAWCHSCHEFVCAAVLLCSEELVSYRHPADLAPALFDSSTLILEPLEEGSWHIGTFRA